MELHDNFFTGIGSRKLPACQTPFIYYISRYLTMECGYILRSGAAIGADSAFESGVHSPAQDKCEIYVPTARFKQQGCRKIHVSSMSSRMDALALIEKHSLHENWSQLLSNPANSYAVGCHLRNVFQVLGELGGKPPVKTKFICCWTPDGAQTFEETSKKTGGTRTAIRLACLNGIRVINLAREENVIRIHNKIKHLYTPSYTPDINEILRHCRRA